MQTSRRLSLSLFVPLASLILWCFCSVSHAADLSLPGVDVQLDQGETQGVATAIKILLVLTVLSLAPALMVVMTSFSRIIIVLSMLRQAFGMQQTPPNTVLVSLALFLTLFSMSPILKQINEQAYGPFMEGKLELDEAATSAMQPLREFMLRQTNESDLALLVEISGESRPTNIDEVNNIQLIPAFMLSELKTAFQIGFVIFLPFLLIDIVVASILMSMGMLMVPPMTISLPIKILMFVLIDGWNLVVGSLMGSFT